MPLLWPYWLDLRVPVALVTLPTNGRFSYTKYIQSKKKKKKNFKTLQRQWKHISTSSTLLVQYHWPVRIYKDYATIIAVVARFTGPCCFGNAADKSTVFVCKVLYRTYEYEYTHCRCTGINLQEIISRYAKVWVSMVCWFQVFRLDAVKRKLTMSKTKVLTWNKIKRLSSQGSRGLNFFNWHFIPAVDL